MDKEEQAFRDALILLINQVGGRAVITDEMYLEGKEKKLTLRVYPDPFEDGTVYEVENGRR